MKVIIIKAILYIVVSSSLFGCASTDNEYDPFTNTSNEAPKIHKNKAGGKEAVLGVALAITIGAINRDDFECSKDCEEALKESLANANKYK